MLKRSFSTPNGLARGVSRPQAGEGAYGVRKRSFRLMLKLHFSTQKAWRAVPLAYKRARVQKLRFRLMLKLRFSTPNRSACGSPLSHAVGEGRGSEALTARL